MKKERKKIIPGARDASSASRVPIVLVVDGFEVVVVIEGGREVGGGVEGW